MARSRKQTVNTKLGVRLVALRLTRPKEMGEEEEEEQEEEETFRIDDRAKCY